MAVLIASPLPTGAQSVWIGESTFDDRYGRGANWSTILPPVTPLQNALFTDVPGNTNIRLVGFFGGGLTAGPTTFRFENNSVSYNIEIPSNSDLRLQELIMDGNADVALVGHGVLRGQLLSLGALDIVGGGFGTLDIGVRIIDRPLELISTRIVHDRQNGSLTRFSGENTYSGGTQLLGGTLQTQSLTALGTGLVELDGGVLAPQTTLNIDSLEWGAGTIALTVGDGAVVEIDNELANTGGGGAFLFAAGAGFEANTFFRLINFGFTDFLEEEFSGTQLFGIAPEFHLLGDGLDVIFRGASSGSILQNSAPIFTPLHADFLVQGTGTTGTPLENNMVNSLLFAPDSSLRVFNTLMVTSGNLTVGSGEGTISGGMLFTPGNFTKLGGGTLNLLGNLLAGGQSFVNEGGLLVNGILQSSQVNVLPGALLGGSGTILGNLLNRGVVSPGNSIGTLTVTGNYVQTASGNFLLEIAGTNAFDRLVVGGSARLGGSLTVRTLSGFTLEYGQTFPFLTAHGGIIGNFDRIHLPGDRFRGRTHSFDGNTLVLIVAPDTYTRVARTPNQHRVARALDQYIPAAYGSDRYLVSLSLDLLTGKQYPVAFEQIMPGYYETLANLTVEQSQAQGQFLQQRMNAVRLGSRGYAHDIDLPVVHEGYTKRRDPKQAVGPAPTEDWLTPSVDNRWGAWVQGYGLFARNRSIVDVPNSRTESGGFLVGLDYRWNERFAGGLFTGYQGSRSKFDQDGRIGIDTARFGGYGSFDSGEGWYVDTAAWAGYSSYSVRRPIQFSLIDRTARSRPDGAEISSLIGGGYDWTAGNLTFGPAASLQYTFVGIGSVGESGADALDLALANQRVHSLRSRLGARVAYTLELAGDMVLIPEARLFWQRENLNNSRMINAALDGGAGPGFDFQTDPGDRNSLFVGGGVVMQFSKRTSGYLYYNSDVGRGNYTGHMVSGGMEFRW